MNINMNNYLFQFHIKIHNIYSSIHSSIDLSIDLYPIEKNMSGFL